MVNGNDMNAYSEERCKVRTKGRFQTIVKHQRIVTRIYLISRKVYRLP